MHCLPCFLHASEACTCLSFLPSSLLYTQPVQKLLLASFLFSSPYWMSLSGAMFYAVWIVNKWKGSLRHCCSVLFLALHHHEFSQKTDSKSRNGEKEGRRGKKEGRGNVIELPWKISITYLLNQLYEVLSEKKAIWTSNHSINCQISCHLCLRAWNWFMEEGGKRMKWRICVVIDPMTVLVRIHTIGQM